MPDALHLTVRTPHAVIVDEPFDAIRVPTPSGDVGLRRHAEPSVLVLEPGVVFLQRGGSTRFLATAGGLLRNDRNTVEAFTAFALTGDDPKALREKLDQALATPSEEATLRRELGRLESEIVRELRRREAPGRPVER